MITFEVTDMFLCAVLAGNSDGLSSTSLFADKPTADAGREEPLDFFSSLYRATCKALNRTSRSRKLRTAGTRRRTRMLSVCVLVRKPVDNCETIRTTSSAKFTSTRCCASSDGVVCALGSHPTNRCRAQGRSRSTDPNLCPRVRCDAPSSCISITRCPK